MKKFSLKTEADTFRKLSLYLSSNISLVESIRILEDETKLKKIKAIFAKWRAVVEDGKTLAEACEVEVSELGRYSVDLGTRTGSLPEALREASSQTEKMLSVRKKILSAIAYPSAILIGTFGLVLGLILFVFPKIIPLFETLKVTLPLSTRMLVGFSRFLTNYWWLVVLLGAFLLAVFLSLKRISPKFVIVFDNFILKIPVVGAVVKLKIVSNIFGSLYMLLRGGEQLSEALLSTAKSVSVFKYKRALSEASQVVADGRLVSDFFKSETKLFPAYIFGIVSAGERTGSLEASMKHISEISEEDLGDKLRVLTATLEPMLMVTMSLVIGFIALSIILPIYGITSHFQNV